METFLGTIHISLALTITAYRAIPTLNSYILGKDQQNSTHYLIFFLCIKLLAAVIIRYIWFKLYTFPPSFQAQYYYEIRFFSIPIKIVKLPTGIICRYIFARGFWDKKIYSRMHNANYIIILAVVFPTVLVVYLLNGQIYT